MWICFPWEDGFREDLFIMWIWYTGWAVRDDGWVILTQDTEILVTYKNSVVLCVWSPAGSIQSPPRLWGRSPPSRTRWHWERRLSGAFWKRLSPAACLQSPLAPVHSSERSPLWGPVKAEGAVWAVVSWCSSPPPHWLLSSRIITYLQACL